ncbi:MAG: hypothetical protein WB496_04320, partial [Pseudolabrys sp.]
QLAGDLPRYQSNLGEKIQALRGAATASGTLEQASQVLRTRSAKKRKTRFSCNAGRERPPG